jgi:2'-5' RNA ligase
MPASKRLFVALWPDMPVRQQISAVQKQVTTATGMLDGAVAFENLHMTLQFLGDMPLAAIDKISASLAYVTAQPFHLTLDRWGQFAKPGILWIGPGEPVAPLQRLQADVISVLKTRAGGARERPYKPHLTLFRKVSHLPAVDAFEPVEWLVDRFVLVESNTHPDGVKYKVLQEYLFH